MRPMLAETATEAPDGDWAFEVKYDGWRAMSYIEAGRLRVVSRRGHDLTAQLGHLAPLATAAGQHRLILDGELVVLDGEGKPSLERLARAMQGEAGDVTLMLFDLLHLDGNRLERRPLAERKRRLLALGLDGERFATVRCHVGDGAALWAASRAHGLEGLMAKRLDAPYAPGRRCASWLKLKNFVTRKLVIGGFVRHEHGSYGVLVGEPTRARLVFAGVVDVGVTPALIARLQPLVVARTPFAPGKLSPEASPGVSFIRPELVAEVDTLMGSPRLRDARLRRLLRGEARRA
jgi:bifunctional non-homologous end joining protein LigD